MGFLIIHKGELKGLKPGFKALSQASSSNEQQKEEKNYAASKFVLYSVFSNFPNLYRVKLLTHFKNLIPIKLNIK